MAVAPPPEGTRDRRGRLPLASAGKSCDVCSRVRPWGQLLADDMGLGKTFQTVAFVSGLLTSKLARSVLVVAPASVVNGWRAEFEVSCWPCFVTRLFLAPQLPPFSPALFVTAQKWAPRLDVRLFHGPDREANMAALRFVQRRGGILVSTYTTAANASAILSRSSCSCSFNCRKSLCDCECHTLARGRRAFDWIVLDEGHKVSALSRRFPTRAQEVVRLTLCFDHSPATHAQIKNIRTKWAQNLREISCMHRLILSGTPIQVRGCGNVVVTG